MKCPYPDCTGQVTLGEQFCGECGRALTWENGQPKPVGAAGSAPDPGATRVMSDVPMPVLPPPPPPTTPGGTGIYTPPSAAGAYTPPSGTPQPGGPPAYTPPGTPSGPPPYTTPMGAPPPGYTPPVAMPAAPARRGPNPVLLVVVGGVAGIALLCVACFALGIAGSLLAGTVTATPEPLATRVTSKLPTATTRALGRATATTAPLVEDTPVLPSDTPMLPEDTPGTEATPGVATPDAEATASASDFDLNFTDYNDAQGGVVIVGTVHNKGSDRLENVKVTAELLNAAGATVGTGDDSMLPLAIMEGDQTLPFQVRVPSPGEGADRIHVQVQADVYDTTAFRVFDPAPKLSVEGTTLGKGVLGPNITGRVRNDGSKAATLVNVIAAGYDADGKLVDTGTGYITSDVAAGSTAPFDLMFLRPDVAIAKFDIAVIGQEKP